MRLAHLGVVLLALLASERRAEADLLARMVAAGDDQGGGSGQPPATGELGAWAGPARPITLPELLQHTVQHAPALASARIDIAIAEARIEQTYGRDDWQILGVGTASRTSGFINGQDVDRALRYDGTLDVGRQLPTGGTVSLHAGTEYTSFRATQIVEGTPVSFTSEGWAQELSATLSQPLLRNRGRWIYEANERRAVLARDATALTRQLVAIQSVQAVVAAYWDLVLAERQVAITQASLELAKERLRITQIGNDGGKVPRSEIPAVQQIIATREEDVLNGEMLALDRSIALRRAAGLPIGRGELGLRVGTDLALREAAFDLGELTERAFTASPELMRLAKQDSSTTIDIEVTENGLMPRLDAALTLGINGSDDKFATAWKNLGQLDTYSILGTLTFEHTIGQENVRGLAREFREGKRKLQVTSFDIRAQIAQAMSRAVAQAEVAKRRVALSQRAIDLANENIKIESDRFNLGKATNFDVLNRQEELRQAELRKAQAIIDWHKADTAVQALTTDILGSYGITVK